MSDVNRVTLSGRLAADPELKYLPSGTAVANLRLASNRTYTSNGERREEALFVDVEVYGKAGEAVAQHKAKGAFLVVDGRLRQNTWEREGQRHRASSSWPTTSASARVWAPQAPRKPPPWPGATRRMTCRSECGVLRLK